MQNDIKTAYRFNDLSIGQDGWLSGPEARARAPSTPMRRSCPEEKSTLEYCNGRETWATDIQSSLSGTKSIELPAAQKARRLVIAAVKCASLTFDG